MPDTKDKTDMCIEILDDDRGRVTAMLDGKQIRAWFYVCNDGHRVKMMMAREFAEGWYQCCKRLSNIGEAK